MSVKRRGTDQAVERTHVDEFTMRPDSSHSPHVRQPEIDHGVIQKHSN